ncbi:hypothetical protein MUK42_05843 [Musa troglodytarum]|uniref:Uncharacterized protein n=1 Tax=Musa troglodytarum TaxID=320322 RepID=A0A9E7KWR3_9LILI|nr:hypothetical protein MUK42_05843 [Musa troglodytarum]
MQSCCCRSPAGRRRRRPTVSRGRWSESSSARRAVANSRRSKRSAATGRATNAREPIVPPPNVACIGAPSVAWSSRWGKLWAATCAAISPRPRSTRNRLIRRRNWAWLVYRLTSPMMIGL